MLNFLNSTQNAAEALGQATQSSRWPGARPAAQVRHLQLQDHLQVRPDQAQAQAHGREAVPLPDLLQGILRLVHSKAAWSRAYRGEAVEVLPVW